MRFLVALIFACLAGNVAHAGIVVWMNDAIDPKLTDRADNKTGGTDHTTALDLAFPPQPDGADDEAAWEALRKAISDGKKRWNEFEVELQIAQDLGTAIEGITAVRSEADRERLIEALLFQGAAASIAFEPHDFIENADAEPYRIAKVGGAIVRPWADAIALDPDRAPTASDVADGASFPQLSSQLEDIKALEPGTLTFTPMGPGDERFVDGRKVEEDTIELAPGLHWVHLMRDGRIAGRRVVRVESGKTVEHERYVTPDEVATARERVLNDTTTGFPESIQKGLTHLADLSGGQVFVGAEEDGKMVVLPYAHGAALLKQRRVTLLGVGGVGGGLMISPIFDLADGENRLAPMVNGDLGFELGLLNAVVLGGVELAMTPGNTITHGKRNSDDNIDTSTYLQPYGGLGVYLLRPTGRKATLLLAGNYQWMHPAHHAVGGRFSLGLPFDQSGAAWLRVTAGGAGFPKSNWDEGDDATQMVKVFLRMGVARRF